MATRGRRRARRGFRPSLGLFLLVNIVPLTVGSFLLYRWLTGDLPTPELPAGLGTNLAVIAAAILALVLAASLSLPAAHGVARGLEERLRTGREVLAGRRGGSRLLVLLAWPFLALTFGVAALVRLILILVSLALIAAVLVFGVRLFVPDFCQQALEALLAWRV